MRTLLNRIALWAVVAVATCPAVALSQTGTPAAVLTSCKGPVTVTHAGASSPAAFGSALSDGDEVKTGTGAEAEIMFAAGNWVQIGANSSMRIKGHPGAAAAPGAKETAGDKKNAGNFEVVQSFLKLKNAEGSSAVGGLRSGEKAPRLVALSPCQTRVRASRPVFTWKIDDPSTELKLTVYEESNTVWQTFVENATTAVYPADAPALKAGVSYSWTLETGDPLVSPPLRTPAAFFTVLAPADASALDADLARLDPTQGTATYHLTRASLYYDRGLVDDAISETRSALAVDPGNPTLQSILNRLVADTGHAQ